MRAGKHGNVAEMRPREEKKRTVAAADEIMKKEGNKGSKPILFFRCAC